MDRSAVFLVQKKFLDAYSFLRWAWIACQKLLQRWFFLIKCAVISTVKLGWLLNTPESIIRFHRDALLIVITVMAVGGSLQRRILQILVMCRSTRPLHTTKTVQVLGQKLNIKNSN